MKYKYLFSSLFIMLFLASITVKSQEKNSQNELQSLLDKAEKATKQYSETFKNLTAEETKTFEDYDKQGKVQETRKIRSTFIVYQTPKNDEVNEFRNILEFNGKNVARSEEETQKLFKKLAEVGYVSEEWKKIINEGIRYDGKSTAWGMTLWQETPLGKLKPFFEFKIAGKKRIEGREVIIVDYQQIAPTLLIKFNPTVNDWKKEPQGREYHASAPAIFRPFNPSLKGQLWLDAETAQIWRNEFKISIKPSLLSKPVVGLNIICEYQPSEFKILVPKKFAYTIYKISGTNDKTLSVTKERTMLFEYSKFTEFKSETTNYKIADN